MTDCRVVCCTGVGPPEVLPYWLGVVGAIRGPCLVEVADEVDTVLL